MKSFKTFLSESLAIESVNTDKVGSAVSSVLKSLGVDFKGVDVHYQRVFGGAELQIRVNDAVIDGHKLDYFGIQVQQNGDVTANAKSKELRRNHLVSLPRVGQIKTLAKLESSKGLFGDIIKFTVDEIKDEISNS